MLQASYEPNAALQVAEAAAAGTAAIVIIAIGAYALGSFLLMGGHVTARHFGSSLRALIRELWVAGFTQPLIPLFYLVGYRMDGLFVRQARAGLENVAAPVPIVFVHGYMQNRVGFIGLARALARKGVGPMYGFNYPWFASIGSNAARLDRFVRHVCKETGAAAVDLVCHSMGGLIAMEMMRDEALHQSLKVRRCVTIATPHAGVMWRGPIIGVGATSLRRGSKLLEAHAGHKLAVPCLSLYSTHDNIVHPKESSSLALRGGRDIEVEGLAHLSILFAPEVAEHVAAFLAEPSDPKSRYSPRAMPESAESATMSSPFAMTSPATGSPLSDVTATPLDDIAAIVTKAREAQSAWAALTVTKRIRAISVVKNRILASAELIAKTVHEETGKPDVEALLGEVLASADVVNYWAETIADELEPFEAEIDALSYPKKSGLIHRDPRGTIAVIMPWNFPFALPLRTMIPALMAGNAVVFKPSEITPRTGKLVADLFEGLVPAGLVALVQGGGDAGARLCAADVDLVVFTGSPASGRKVAHACADRLIPCTLELGGKDAAIVLADADLDRAANGIVWGAMMNAGQNCGAVERVYADKSIVKDLTDRVIAATRALRIGDDVGPLTTHAQRATVERHVEAARAAGAVVHVGGEALDTEHSKLGYKPTVITIDADDNALIADETFGPVIPITAVADVHEAVRRANASRYGLTASVWTSDVRAGEALAKRLRAGVVTINNHSFTGALPSAPWGGVGETGWGITGSPLALDHLTRPRFVCIDRNRAAREMWWYPYSDTLRNIALAFARLRGGAPSIFSRIGAVFSLIALLPKRMSELKAATKSAQPPERAKPKPAAPATPAAKPATPAAKPAAPAAKPATPAVKSAAPAVKAAASAAKKAETKEVDAKPEAAAKTDDEVE